MRPGYQQVYSIGTPGTWRSRGSVTLGTAAPRLPAVGMIETMDVAEFASMSDVARATAMSTVMVSTSTASNGDREGIMLVTSLCS